MAAALALHFDPGPFERALRELGRRGPIAMARALNRTASSERTAMARAVAADMGLQVASARNAITVERASAQRLAARVVARGRRLPLIDFKARGPSPSRGRSGGVTYVMQGQRKRLSQAFITTVTRAGERGHHQGHRGVFIRLGRRRLPIKQLYGVSVARSFQNQLPAGEARRAELLQKNITHEIAFELSRLRAT